MVFSDSTVDWWQPECQEYVERDRALLRAIRRGTIPVSEDGWPYHGREVEEIDKGAVNRTDYFDSAHARGD